MTVTREQASAIAQDAVGAIGAESGDELALLAEETVETPGGWVFFYDTRAFIQSRNPIDRLAGNGPIFVALDGKARNLPTAIPWQEAIKRA